MKPETLNLVRLTVDEAIEHATAAAFDVVDPDSPDYGRKIVHRMGSFTGADCDLEGVIATLKTARDIAWLDHFADHDLAVLTDEGKLWRYGVKRPEPAQAEQGRGEAADRG